MTFGEGIGCGSLARVGRRLHGVEFIRFALLLTLTVALINVAGRIGDHPTSAQGPTGTTGTPSASPLPSAGPGHRGHHGHHGPGPDSTPGRHGGSGATGPGSGPGSGDGDGDGGGGTTTTAAGGTSSSGPTQPAVAALPRSGTGIVDLAGVAVFMVASGAFVMSSAARRP
jgi:hypothetical protein